MALSNQRKMELTVLCKSLKDSEVRINNWIIPIKATTIRTNNRIMILREDIMGFLGIKIPGSSFLSSLLKSRRSLRFNF